MSEYKRRAIRIGRREVQLHKPEIVARPGRAFVHDEQRLIREQLRGATFHRSERTLNVKRPSLLVTNWFDRVYQRWMSAIDDYNGVGFCDACMFRTAPSSKGDGVLAVEYARMKMEALILDQIVILIDHEMRDSESGLRVTGCGDGTPAAPFGVDVRLKRIPPHDEFSRAVSTQEMHDPSVLEVRSMRSVLDAWHKLNGMLEPSVTDEGVTYDPAVFEAYFHSLFYIRRQFVWRELRKDGHTTLLEKATAIACGAQRLADQSVLYSCDHYKGFQALNKCVDEDPYLEGDITYACG